MELDSDIAIGTQKYAFLLSRYAAHSKKGQMQIESTEQLTEDTDYHLSLLHCKIWLQIQRSLQIQLFQIHSLRAESWNLESTVLEVICWTM